MQWEIERGFARDTDNYNYLLRQGDKVWWVDPLYPLKFLKMIKKQGWSLEGILITHTHWDHIDGIEQVQEKHDCPVYVHELGIPDLTTAKNVQAFPADKIQLGDIEMEVHHTPGHHPAHIILQGGGVAVVGDVLFRNGCGSPLFGGNIEEIADTLIRLPEILNDDSVLLWGHDYDLGNIKWGLSILPGDPALTKALSEAEATTQNERPTPQPLRTWAEEKQVNLFARLDELQLAETLQSKNPDVELHPRAVAFELRLLRNQW
jgi:hydroxyacylglutathione hydrolase